MTSDVMILERGLPMVSYRRLVTDGWIQNQDLWSLSRYGLPMVSYRRLVTDVSAVRFIERQIMALIP